MPNIWESSGKKEMDLRIFLLMVLGTIVLGAPVEDLVENLPGLQYPVTYDQYSGYINGTKGRHLHYWLTESQNDASSDPLILWLNGGPGCSSVSGLLTENGPFRVSDNDEELLVPNPYAWNIVGNVLFLESPACVGFSYDDKDDCRTSDEEVAEMNYYAIQNFFKKFPEYVNRDFYITGESYAGIYIPTLSVKIANSSTFQGNFKGYAIGNGLLNYTTNDNALLFFGYHHGLIGEEEWSDLISTCCQGISLNEERNCEFNQSSLQCTTVYSKALTVIYDRNLNIYNLYGDCVKHHHNFKESRYTSRYNFDLENMFRNRRPSRISYGDPPCTDSYKEVTYLNNPRVRKALHIPEHVQEWQTCSRKVGLTYQRQVLSSMPYIETLQKKGIPGLLYNGDVDMACNFLGNEWDIATLGLKTLKKRRAWMVNNQVGGYVDRYDHLDFVTVRGSGHMVPTDNPAEALHLLKAFVNNEEY